MSSLATQQLPVLQGANGFRFTDDSRVVSGKDESSAEVVSHLLHQSENHVRGLMIQVCGRFIGKHQLWLSD
jgi:hypothetical protein